jgi:hypothetical protein
MNEHPCKYGHFDCASAVGGDCSNERFAIAFGIVEQTVEKLGRLFDPKAFGFRSEADLAAYVVDQILEGDEDPEKADVEEHIVEAIAEQTQTTAPKVRVELMRRAGIREVKHRLRDDA